MSQRALLTIVCLAVLGLGVPRAWAEGREEAETAHAGAEGTCPEGMAYIAGGTYTLHPPTSKADLGSVRVAGSPYEKSTVRAFCLDKTEVTVGAYQGCMQGAKCAAAKEQLKKIRSMFEAQPRFAKIMNLDPGEHCNADKGDRANHPMNCVTWYEAAAYCESMGKRLPSEEQWEWAARGREENRPFPWGHEAPASQLCWSTLDPNATSPKHSCPVGSYPAGASRDGVLDLAGNVREWTVRSITVQPDGTIVRPKASIMTAVKGSSWANWLVPLVGIARRSEAPKLLRQSELGFRCAAAPPRAVKPSRDVAAVVRAFRIGLKAKVCPTGTQSDGQECKDSERPAQALANEKVSVQRLSLSELRQELLGRLHGPGQVLIKGGTYTMGDKEAKVTVSDFYLDKTEVTVAAYLACVSSGKCPAAHTSDEECNADKPDRSTHPINCVDWHEANNYCVKAGGRLPTEEEWEWAARSRDEGRTYTWGNDAPANQLCWNGAGNDLGKGKRQTTCAVGTYLRDRTQDGVQDMAGNVAEWTSTMVKGGGPLRVLRFGSCANNTTDYVRAAKWDNRHASSRSYHIGFRCAKSP